jgi:hypothetical protein
MTVMTKYKIKHKVEHREQEHKLSNNVGDKRKP